MIGQDKIAAATIAQIFGSELLRVDSTTSEAGNQCLPATRIDPKKILLDQQRPSLGVNEREKQMIEMLQREAESTHPIYDNPSSSEAQIPTHSSSLPNLDSSILATHSNIVNSEVCLVAEKINTNLEKISGSLQQIVEALNKVDVNFRRKPMSLLSE